jgi:hypothetical protein
MVVEVVTAPDLILPKTFPVVDEVFVLIIGGTTSLPDRSSRVCLATSGVIGLYVLNNDLRFRLRVLSVL